MTPLYSYESREAHDLDVENALKLLLGFLGQDKHGKLDVHFCSASTKPTEREARLALCRVLLSGDVPDALRALVAVLFVCGQGLFGQEPNPLQRKVEFTSLSTGHSKFEADLVIATVVQVLRRGSHYYDKARNVNFRGNCSYDKAIGSVAKVFMLSESQVKKIYAKYKGSPILGTKLDELYRGIEFVKIEHGERVTMSDEAVEEMLRSEAEGLKKSINGMSSDR
jgi:hypothetical protein